MEFFLLLFLLFTGMGIFYYYSDLKSNYVERTAGKIKKSNTSHGHLEVCVYENNNVAGCPVLPQYKKNFENQKKKHLQWIFRNIQTNSESQK